MERVRWVAWVVATAGLAVTGAVATGQILNEGKVSGTWLYLSLGVAVLAVVCAKAPGEGAAAPADVGGARGAGGAGRGGRGVYLRQLRAAVREMETVGVATRGEFVLRMRQVYVDVSLVPQPVHEREPHIGAVAAAQVEAPGERQTLKSFLVG